LTVTDNAGSDGNGCGSIGRGCFADIDSVCESECGNDERRANRDTE
jgi:hypothetical protein